MVPITIYHKMNKLLFSNTRKKNIVLQLYRKTKTLTILSAVFTYLFIFYYL